MTSIPVPDSGTVSDASEHTRPAAVGPKWSLPRRGPTRVPPSGTCPHGWDPGMGGQGSGDRHQERLFSEKLNAHAAPRGEPWAASLFPEVGAVELVQKVVRSS